MHEWLEALEKSARKKAPGVAAEELRRAETECGVPLPGELGDLYSAFNGGEFEGEVVLFPLHGEGEQPSVLEKTRKMLVGLPAAGVWRFGLKGRHRHLYTARKSAMVEQGDGGGPLPEWVNTLGDEDWVYGTWDEEKDEMRLYRSLSNMLNVLVPPVEHEQFGDRTFARAIAAVQGALSELAEGEEGEEGEEEAESENGETEQAGATGEAGEEEEAGEEKEGEEKEPASRELEKPAVIAAERRVKRLTEQAGAKKQDRGLEEAAVVAAERRLKRLREEKAAEAPKKPAARKAPTKQVATKKVAVPKASAKKASAKKASAKKAPAKKAPAKKAPAKKASAKKAPAKKAPAKKASAKKAPARKAPAKKMPARKAVKKAPAKKATGARRKR